jgi:hypothetical protein
MARRGGVEDGESGENCCLLLEKPGYFDFRLTDWWGRAAGLGPAPPRIYELLRFSFSIRNLTAVKY